MAIQFFPSNPAQAAVAQTIYSGDAARDVARIRAEEARALAQMQLQAQQQQAEREGFWRQQQAQQRDALARQELQSADFFNRGKLKNDEAQIAATLELRKAQLAPQLGKIEEAKAAEAQDMAMLGTQLGNLAKVRNDYDRLAGELSKLSALETAQAEQMKLPEPPGTLSRFFRGQAAGAVPLLAPARALDYWSGGKSGTKLDPFGAEKTTGFKPQATTADGRKIAAMDFTEPKKRMQDELTKLADIIKSNQELTALLAKAPDGSWVPAIPGMDPQVAPQRAPFFNAPAPATVTNTPVVVPAAPVAPMPVAPPPVTNAPALQRWTYVPGQGLVPR